MHSVPLGEGGGGGEGGCSGRMGVEREHGVGGEGGGVFAFVAGQGPTGTLEKACPPTCCKLQLAHRGLKDAVGPAGFLSEFQHFALD